MRLHTGKEIAWGWVRIILMLVGAVSCSQAQVAITEVMSDGSTWHCSTNVSNSPDWFELTNFGTNVVDLSEYAFLDSDKLFPDQATNIFEGIVIAPQESIILLRADSGFTTTEAFYTHWWGSGDANARVFFYPKTYGLDKNSDAVLLIDSEKNLIQMAGFSRAQLGHTFIYDTSTGQFGQISETNGCGVIQAFGADDYGSPGTTCGPVVMRIMRQPENRAVEPGEEVCLNVEAAGLPRPRYQWYHDGMPVPGGKSPCLRFDSVDPEHAGRYWVTLDNGLESVQSDTVMLSVNTSNAPPAIICAPSDAPLSLGQSTVFSVRAGGYPRPSYQWFHRSETNSQGMGVPILNATNSSMTIIRAEMDLVGTYTVRVTNLWGTNIACAALKVQPKPRLIISEVMNQACTNNSNSPYEADWWELTNLESTPVNLCGYRWDDIDLTQSNGIPRLPPRADPCQTCCPKHTGIATITEDLIIKPGESIIFVEAMTRTQFIDWWGRDNLPSDLKVITYTGNGLDFAGEVITVWDATATELTDFIGAVDFSGPNPGVSVWFPPPDSDSLLPVLSVAGEKGAFRSAKGCDIGSPGKYHEVIKQRVVRWGGGGMSIQWEAEPSVTYMIEYKDYLGQTEWQFLSQITPGQNLGNFTVTTASRSQRFYRISRKYSIP